MDYYVDLILEPIRALLAQVGAHLPGVAASIVVLIVGWLIAKALRFAAVRGLRAINFNVLTERAGIDGFLQQGGIERDTTAFLGALAYWLVILSALVIAANVLGLAFVSDLLVRVLLFVPQLLVALLVIVFGAYFARFVSGAVQSYCRSAEMQDADLLGGIAQYAILVLVILIALEQLGIAGEIVRYTFLILFAGIVLALAIAFGLGGRRWAAELLQRWWPTHTRSDDDEPPR
jgi:hypothetical protein